MIPTRAPRDDVEAFFSTCNFCRGEDFFSRLPPSSSSVPSFLDDELDFFVVHDEEVPPFDPSPGWPSSAPSPSSLPADGGAADDGFFMTPLIFFNMTYVYIIVQRRYATLSHSRSAWVASDGAAVVGFAEQTLP
jgi:hypothetical protein